MAENKVAANVLTFLDRAAQDYANFEAERFTQNRYCELLEMGFGSPIEQLFWIAAYNIVRSEYLELNPSPIPCGKGEFEEGFGVFIRPQAQIGKYRADFLIHQNGIGPRQFLSPVVVELDGHAFHDKDKHQRSYEKARDRFFVKQGYRVLHFTGSDVVKDPYAVAFEAQSLVCGAAGAMRETYNKEDPMNLGEAE